MIFLPYIKELEYIEYAHQLQRIFLRVAQVAHLNMSSKIIYTFNQRVPLIIRWQILLLIVKFTPRILSLTIPPSLSESAVHRIDDIVIHTWPKQSKPSLLPPVSFSCSLLLLYALFIFFIFFLACPRLASLQLRATSSLLSAPSCLISS